MAITNYCSDNCLSFSQTFNQYFTKGSRLSFLEIYGLTWGHFHFSDEQDSRVCFLCSLCYNFL